MAIVQRDHPNEGGPPFIFRERRQPGVHHIGKPRREGLHFFTYGPDRRVVVGRVEKVAWAGFRSRG